MLILKKQRSWRGIGNELTGWSQPVFVSQENKMKKKKSNPALTPKKPQPPKKASQRGSQMPSLFLSYMVGESVFDIAAT